MAFRSKMFIKIGRKYLDRKRKRQTDRVNSSSLPREGKGAGKREKRHRHTE